MRKVNRNIKMGIRENYQDINSYVLNESQNKPHRNYIYLLTAPEKDNFSIVCKYTERDRYYGLHPSITTTLVKSIIFEQNSLYSSQDNLFRYITNNIEKWNTDFNDIELEKALFAKAMLVMASKFYLLIKLESEEDVNEFCKVLNKIDVEVYQKMDENTIKIYGRIPDVILKELEMRKYTISFVEDDLIYISKTIHKKTIMELYSSEHKKLMKCESPPFYSGVNPRLIEIKCKDIETANENLQTLELLIERTTYGTICCFDNYVYNKHMYLNEYTERLNKIDIDEVMAQNKYLNFINSNIQINIQDSIEVVNSYLRHSTYPHYINVSANIVTSDNYCIYTKRGNKTADANTFYCSANGVSEIFDSNIDFYKNSVEEDTPTLYYNMNHKRNDFNGELSRESDAELGVSSFRGKWKYYGISIMGRISATDVHRIPIHFNILAENFTQFTFDQVISSANSAVEKNENEKIFGYKLNIYQTRWQWLRGGLKKFIETINSYSNIIIMIALIITFSYSLIFDIQSFGQVNTPIQILDIVELILCIPLFSALVINIIEKIKESRIKKTVSIIMTPNTVYQTLEKCSKGVLGKKEYENAHAILLLMNSVYILRRVKKSNTDK